MQWVISLFLGGILIASWGFLFLLFYGLKFMAFPMFCFIMYVVIKKGKRKYVSMHRRAGSSTCGS
jgi:integral membrane sensor domain MASE1